MSDTSGPVEGQATSTAPAETSSAPAHDPIADRMDQLTGTVGDLVSNFQAFQQSQQPAEPEVDPMAPWAALWGEEEAAPEPVQQGLDPAALQSAFQTALQQANAPLMQQVQQLQQAQARETLLAQIPALKDPAVANATIEAMHQSLTSSGAEPGFIQWALQNPGQIALHFKAAEAEKLAAGQAPASEHVPGVESAGGALPGGNGAPVNPVHQAYGANSYELPKGFR